MLYRDWLHDWLENYVQPAAKLRTFNRYSEIVRLHLDPALGRLTMEELTPLILQGFVKKLTESGNLRTGQAMAPNSVNTVITLIQSSLKMAHSLGFVREYTAAMIKRPKSHEKRVDCFTLEEQKRIERYVLSCGKEKLFGVVLCMYTGLRIGEALALEWDDVDLQKCELAVNKSCHDGKKEDGLFGRIIDLPKTTSSLRTVPFPRQLAQYLRAIKKKSRSIFVISSDTKPIAVRSYQRTFAQMLCRLGIPHRPFHSLRHTFATRALECGMDVKTLSEILGHKSPTVTLNRYVHSLMEHKKQMMNRLGKLL